MCTEKSKNGTIGTSTSDYQWIGIDSLIEMMNTR